MRLDFREPFALQRAQTLFESVRLHLLFDGTGLVQVLTDDGFDGPNPPARSNDVLLGRERLYRLHRSRVGASDRELIELDRSTATTALRALNLTNRTLLAVAEQCVSGLELRGESNLLGDLAKRLGESAFRARRLPPQITYAEPNVIDEAIATSRALIARVARVLEVSALYCTASEAAEELTLFGDVSVPLDNGRRIQKLQARRQSVAEAVEKFHAALLPHYLLQLHPEHPIGILAGVLQIGKDFPFGEVSFAEMTFADRLLDLCERSGFTPQQITELVEATLFNEGAHRLTARDGSRLHRIRDCFDRGSADPSSRALYLDLLFSRVASAIEPGGDFETTLRLVSAPKTR